MRRLAAQCDMEGRSLVSAKAILVAIRAADLREGTSGPSQKKSPALDPWTELRNRMLVFVGKRKATQFFGVFRSVLDSVELPDASELVADVIREVIRVSTTEAPTRVRSRPIEFRESPR